MQHKFLFAALLCGAMCLTACLKNEESESVENVRNAKANELNANADFLKAQASAETVRAAAEAAYNNALAKKEEAQAAILNAQAEQEKIQAQLLAVQVQIAQVNLKTQQENLKLLQAQLELQLKGIEAQMKLAEERLANIDAEIEAANLQREAATLAAQAALAAQQSALDALIAQQHADDLAYIQGVAAQYFALQNQILQKEQQIYTLTVQIDDIEWDLEEAYDTLIDDLNDIVNQYYREAALYDYVEETYLGMDAEELADARTVAKMVLIDAQNALAEANEAEQDALDAKNEANNSVYQTIYRNDLGAYWGPGAGTSFEFAYTAGAYAVYVADETWGVNKIALGYLNADNEYVPFHYFNFNAQYPIFAYGEVKDDTAAILTTEEVMAMMAESGSYPNVQQTLVDICVPAETDIDAFEAFLNGYVEEQQEALDAQKELLDAQAENIKAGYESELVSLKARAAEYKKYVDAVSADFKAAEALVEETAAAEDSLYALYQIDAKKQAEAFAAAPVTVQQANKAKNDAIAAFNDASDAKDDADAALTAAQAALAAVELAITTAYGGADVTEALYNRDLAIANAKADVAAAKAALTEAIKKAYTDATTDLATKKTNKENKDKDVDAKLKAWNNAKIALAEKPDDATLKQKEADAKKAYDDAVTAQGDAATELATAQGVFDAAETEYNAKMDDIETAENALAALEEEKADSDWETALAEAQGAVKDAEEAVAAAEKAVADAEEAKDKAIAHADEVADAWNEEVNAMDDESYDAWGEAWYAWDDATDALADLHAAYPQYAAYSAALDEEDETALPAAIAAKEEQVETISWDWNGDGNDVAYADYIEALDAAFEEAVSAPAAEAIEAVKAETEMVKPAYDAAIDAYNEASFAYAVAQVISDFVEEYRDYCQAEYNALAAVTFVDETGAVQDVETYLATIQANIDALELQYNNAIDIYNNNYDVQTALIQTKEAQIAQLQSEIELWTILAAQYQAIIDAWLAEHAE